MPEKYSPLPCLIYLSPLCHTWVCPLLYWPPHLSLSPHPLPSGPAKVLLVRLVPLSSLFACDLLLGLQLKQYAAETSVSFNETAQCYIYHLQVKNIRPSLNSHDFSSIEIICYNSGLLTEEGKVVPGA
jgi:hypothetical protein